MRKILLVKQIFAIVFCIVTSHIRHFFLVFHCLLVLLVLVGFVQCFECIKSTANIIEFSKIKHANDIISVYFLLSSVYPMIAVTDILKRFDYALLISFEEGLKSQQKSIGKQKLAYWNFNVFFLFISSSRFYHNCDVSTAIHVPCQCMHVYGWKDFDSFTLFYRRY